MSNVEVSSGDLPQQVSAAGSARWPPLRALGAIALLLLTFTLFWPTTVSLNVRWQDSILRTYTHGYLIVAIVLWLLWRGRTRWSLVPARMSVLGLIMLIGTSLAWLVAFRAGLQIVHQALLPLIVTAAVLTCFGAAVTWRMRLPLAYLYFAIPVWDAVNPLLQSASAFAVRVLLRLVGIPAFFQGNTFQMPAGAFEIAGGCSGLHFFIVALAIAVLYGELNRDTLATRSKLVVLAGLLAMLANWVRIFVIAIAGQMTGMQHYLVTGEHVTFGWGVFAVMMAIFFLTVRRWPVPSTADDAGPVVRQPAIPMVGAGCALAGLMLGPLWNLIDGQQTAVTPPATLAAVSGWEARPVLDSSWHPVFQGADLQAHSEYQSGGDDVETYTALYSEQRQGKEVVSHDNSVLGVTLRATAVTLPAAPKPWAQLEGRDEQGARWLVWYTYRIGEQRQSSGLRAQLAYGIRSLFDDPTASVLALRIRCLTDCTGAQAVLTRFAASSN